MTAAGVRRVGIDVQQNSEDSRHIIEAIEEDNPDCTVTHFPGLIKIQAPGQLVIRRETVEKHLTRPWETHEFQMVIVTYYGNIQEWDDDEIVIAWDH